MDDSVSKGTSIIRLTTRLLLMWTVKVNEPPILHEGHLRMLWTVELNAVSEHQREAHLYVIK